MTRLGIQPCAPTFGFRTHISMLSVVFYPPRDLPLYPPLYFPINLSLYLSLYLSLDCPF